jgi:DNA-binding winged helix-turn-helix (wHTH) protein
MSIPLETLHEIERLKARVEELEWELDCMRDKVNTEVAAIMDFYDLTAGEARMIRAMAHAGGAPLSRAVLVEAIQNEIDDLRTVDSHVKRIRRKVGSRLPIDSIYGIGYRLLSDTVRQVREIMAGNIKPDRHRAHCYLEGNSVGRSGTRPVVPQLHGINRA